MIITSLLDTDLYKFTMMQAVLHQHPGAQVEYRFKCRTPGTNLAQFIDEISTEIDLLCELRFQPDELAYLRAMRFIKPDFVDFLGLFHLDRKYLTLRASTQVPGEIELIIIGPWLHTILFEVPLLAIINEVWFRNTSHADFEEGRRRLQAKVALLARPGYEDCRIADYGTRRRYSRQWQGELLPLLREGWGERFVGTSNVYFARRYGDDAAGHDGTRVPAGVPGTGPAAARFAGGGAGIVGARVSRRPRYRLVRRCRPRCLPARLRPVLLQAVRRHAPRLRRPLRVGGERILDHLEQHRIDPRTKVLVFSDGLNVDKVMRLFDHFKGRCRLSFGVGTHHDQRPGTGAAADRHQDGPLQRQPVAKLSDSPGKSMCQDEDYLRYLRQVFEVEDTAAE